MIPLIIGAGLLYGAGAIFGAGFHSTEQQIIVSQQQPIETVPLEATHHVREWEEYQTATLYTPKLYKNKNDVRASKEFLAAKEKLLATGKAY